MLAHGVDRAEHVGIVRLACDAENAVLDQRTGAPCCAAVHGRQRCAAPWKTSGGSTSASSVFTSIRYRSEASVTLVRWVVR